MRRRAITPFRPMQHSQRYARVPLSQENAGAGMRWGLLISSLDPERRRHEIAARREPTMQRWEQ